jgi:hypothetical protein
MKMHHLMADYENEVVEKPTSFLMMRQRQRLQPKMDE